MDKNSKVLNDDELEKVNGGFDDGGFQSANTKGLVAYELRCPDDPDRKWYVTWDENKLPLTVLCPFCGQKHKRAEVAPRKQTLGFF